MNMKESFTIVDPIPVENDRVRSFTLNATESTTRRGCFVIRKLHIICVLAVILAIGIIVALHQKYKKDQDSPLVSSWEPYSSYEPGPALEYGAEDSAEMEISSVFEPNDGIARGDEYNPAEESTSYTSSQTVQQNENPLNKKASIADRTAKHWDPTIEGDSTDVSDLKHLIQPLAYKIYIEMPDNVNTFNALEQFTFHGNVSIIIRAKQEIKCIIIGASDLRISSANLMSLDESEYGENYKISIDQYDADEGMLVLQVDRPLRPNFKYSLQIEYNGDIQQMPYGLFKISSNMTETGEIKTLISTNTNVPFARTIFPCFDLPTQTASYELHICRGMSMLTEASSPYTVSNTDDSRMCIWENFQSSDVMPLHFFGFVISDYTFKRISIPKNRTFTVWTPYKTCDEISYALEIGPRLISILDNYFGIDLPVQNIDIYPVPSVFPYLSSKLGLIITQESEICIKDYITSEAEKEHIVKNLAAHLIEQWTGFINFEEEQDNWLKESIVQYLQYIAMDLAEPRWKVMEHFFADVHLTEMDTDIINTHKKALNLKYVSRLKRLNKHAPLFPIKETSVFSSHTDYSKIVYSNTDQVQIIPDIYSEIFDRKDIDKGICLIRMIQHIVTEPVFRKSIKKFIESSKKSVETAEDFWDLLTIEAGTGLIPPEISLKAAINDWIYTREYPVINVTRDYDKNTVTFQQFVDPENDSRTSHRFFASIPISYTTEEEKCFSSTAPIFWMKHTRQAVRDNISGLNRDTWILVNPKQTNLYRVNYDLTNWIMLQRSAERGELPADVRAHLVDDALFLARRGQLSYDFAMDFTKSLLKLEKDYVVWNTALHQFGYMRSAIMIDGEQKYEDQRLLFEGFLKNIIQPIYTHINFHGIITKKYYALDQLSPSEHNQLLMESQIFRWACEVNIEKCSVKAKMDFSQWKRQPNPHRNVINPNLRYATLCNAMRVAGESDFEFLYQMYRRTSFMNPNKFVYLKSLYCYNGIEQVIPKILSLTLLNDYSITHLNEVSNIWQALIENPIATTAPFDYTLMYWKSILKTFGDFIPIIRNIIEGATINIHNEQQLNELISLKDSFRNSDKTDIYEILYVSSRHVHNRIAWKNKEMPGFLAWLEKTKPAAR
ncbi:aminopeptidase N-like isoform X2 [Planococcus citri]|uniref:aminopeptidase N-like isoform X2 n=1 Tax=Planococcus citri TaxID=170843 RepID=UPI0031F9CE26